MELKLGLKLSVWLGALALALAGAFLVKYSIDQGLLTPGRRVVGALLLGCGLLVAGRWMTPRSKWIAAALMAAGITTFYTAFFAAVNLYRLISPGLGAVLMMATTVAAELLAMRYGRIVAAVGLVGGYAAPALIPSEEPRPGFLFGYLFLLTFGLSLVAIRRPWTELLAAAFAGALGWAFLWLLGPFKTGDELALGPFLVGLGVLATLVAPRLAAVRRHDFRLDGAMLSWGVWGLSIALTTGAALASSFSDASLIFLAILAGTCLGVGRWRQPFDWLPWIAGGAGLIALAAQPDSGAGADADGLAWRFLVFAVLFGCGGYAALFGAARPSRWASLSAGFLLPLAPLAYAKNAFPLSDFGWGLIGLGLAALFVAAAASWSRYAVPDPIRDGVLAAFAAGVGGLLALAVSVMVSDQWLGLGWALTVLAFAYVHGSLPLPMLRRLAAGLAAVAAAKILGDFLTLSAIHQLPGFAATAGRLGLAAVALGLAAWHLSRANSGVWAEIVQYCAVALGLAWIYWGIRSLFPSAGLSLLYWDGSELGLVLSAWLLYGLLLHALGRRSGSVALKSSAHFVAGLGIAFLAFVALVVANPVVAPIPVGRWPVLNALVLIYAVPATLLMLVARAGMFSGEAPQFMAMLRWLALTLLLWFVTLEVRQFFVGSYLNAAPVSDPELYGYSAVWIACGLVLLWFGLRQDNRALRGAALAVVAFAAVKVFLYDTSALQGLYRVFSFLGLGASLLLIGYGFQRLVARKHGTD